MFYKKDGEHMHDYLAVESRIYRYIFACEETDKI